MRSLSRWLLLSLLTVVTLTGLASAALAYRSSLIEVGELFDAKLAHSARVLRALVERDGAVAEAALPVLPIALWSGPAEGQGDDLATAGGHAYETKLAFQVFAADGDLLLRSENAPAHPLAALRGGFHDSVIAGEHWRSFGLQAASGRWYLAGERADVRGDIAGDIAVDIVVPFALGLPVAGGLIWLLISIGERSLRRVIAALERRAADQLQPLPSAGVPREIDGLVQAINRLLAALAEAMQRERRFTADAAHELRTPLAALRVQLGNLRSAADPAECAAAQRQLERGLTRLDRLVEQLLTLSRLEPGAPLPALQPVELAPLAQAALLELGHAGLGRGLEIALEVSGGARVRGDPTSLGILLRNLIDNALRYTPVDGQVKVSLFERANSVELWVEDSGPGIAESARARVLERFHRELGSGADGSGLGLSIVERIVRIHGAELQLQRSEVLGGLRVVVRFAGVAGPADAAA